MTTCITIMGSAHSSVKSIRSHIECIATRTVLKRDQMKKIKKKHVNDF